MPCAKRCRWTPCRRCSEKVDIAFFARLARDGAPKFLLSLIQNAGGSAATPWATMMLDDLEALWIASPELQPLGSPKLDPVVWFNFAMESPRAWKIACRTYRCFNHRLSGKDDDTQPCFEFPCPRCVKVSYSKKGMCTHLFRVHGERRVVKNFVSSSQCPVCRTELALVSGACIIASILLVVAGKKSWRATSQPWIR